MDATEDNAKRERESRIGRTLCGRYTLESVIGVGGMATVYRGRHRNGHKVAVKVLNRELSASPDLRARFLREGYLANRVEHLGAVDVIDEDVDEDGSVFLVMDLLEGGTLAERIARGRLPRAEIVPLIVQLLDVLEAAHAKQIVHRDIKPENLFVERRDGRLRVLDFGVARLAGDARKTETGRVMGTPAYMAPEQARGEGERVDHRTDLWAVGAVLYRALSGRFVHEADSSQMTMVLAATQAASPLREVLPEADGELCEVVDRALVAKMDERWQSAAEMRLALDPEGEEARRGALASVDVSVARAPTLPEAENLRFELDTRPRAPKPTPPDVTPAPHQFAARPLPRTSRSALKALVGLAAVAALALAWRGARPTPSADANQVSRNPQPEDAPPVAQPPPTSLPSAAPREIEVRAAAPVASVAPPARPAAARVAAHAPASSPKPSASGEATATVASRCDPPYYFDDDGNKRRKLDCYK